MAKSWTVVFTKNAAKAMKKIQRQDAARINDKLAEIAKLDRPWEHHAVTAMVNIDKHYRLRVGKYRVIFHLVNGGVEVHNLEVTDVDTRGDVYKA